MGNSGTGTFTQSGGNNTVAPFYLGDNSGSSGTYNLSGSGQLSASQRVRGQFRLREASRSPAGPTHAPAALYLAANAGSSGTYNLNGGLLVVQVAHDRFRNGGLQFQRRDASGQRWIFHQHAYDAGRVPAAGGRATFDTAGYAMTLSGSLSGPGGLTKVDSGTLILAATNTYSGSTVVNGGTLAVTGSLNPSSPLAVGGGLFSFSPAANGGAGNSQSVAGLTVNAGASAITASTGNTLALGPIAKTRAAW